MEGIAIQKVQIQEEAQIVVLHIPHRRGTQGFSGKRGGR